MDNNNTKLKNIGERCEEWIAEAERMRQSDSKGFTIAEEEKDYMEMIVYRDRLIRNELYIFQIKTLLRYIESNEE